MISSLIDTKAMKKNVRHSKLGRTVCLKVYNRTREINDRCNQQIRPSYNKLKIVKTNVFFILNKWLLIN
ncbi:MAG: hypothetical protein ACTS5A_01065 [Candidatus Hodgkinia cicadicola]